MNNKNRGDNNVINIHPIEKQRAILNVYEYEY